MVLFSFSGVLTLEPLDKRFDMRYHNIALISLCRAQQCVLALLARLSLAEGFGRLSTALEKAVWSVIRMPSLQGQKFINRERPRSHPAPSFSLGSFAASWQGPQPMQREEPGHFRNSRLCHKA